MLFGGFVVRLEARGDFPVSAVEAGASLSHTAHHRLAAGRGLNAGTVMTEDTCTCTCIIYVHIYMHVREMKKGRKKEARSNKYM